MKRSRLKKRMSTVKDIPLKTRLSVRLSAKQRSKLKHVYKNMSTANLKKRLDSLEKVVVSGIPTSMLALSSAPFFLPSLAGTPTILLGMARLTDETAIIRNELEMRRK